MLNILTNIILYGKEKYNKIMSKTASIISKLVSNQYQPIIKGKTPQKAWIAYKNASNTSIQ